MINIPTLNWVAAPNQSDLWQADIGDGNSLRIFPLHRAGYELWLWGREQRYLGWFPTEDEAKAAAVTHVGDDDPREVDKPRARLHVTCGKCWRTWIYDLPWLAVEVAAFLTAEDWLTDKQICPQCNEKESK